MAEESTTPDLAELTRQDHVVTVSRLRGRIRGTGHEVDVPETQVWQIRDGKAAEVRAYMTRAEALKAVGLRGSGQVLVSGVRPRWAHA